MSRITQHILFSTLTLSLLLSCAGQPLNQPAASSAAPSFSQPQLMTLRQKINDDEDFLLRLETDPKGALQTQGLNLPADEQVRVLTINDQIFLILDDRNLKTFHANLLEPNANKSELQRQLDAVRVKALSDSAFKAKLLTNPAETLKAEGIAETIAGMFEVVDYQPGTSFLLIAPNGAEITRKGCGRGCPVAPTPVPTKTPANPALNDAEVAFFNGFPHEIQRLMTKTLASLAIKGAVTKGSVKLGAAGMVAGTGVLCGVSLGLSPFACDKNRGLSQKYWEDAITLHLRNQNVRVQEGGTDTATQQRIEASRQRLALFNKQLVSYETEIKLDPAGREALFAPKVAELRLLIAQEEKLIAELEKSSA